MRRSSSSGGNGSIRYIMAYPPFVVLGATVLAVLAIALAVAMASRSAPSPLVWPMVLGGIASLGFRRFLVFDGERRTLAGGWGIFVAWRWGRSLSLEQPGQVVHAHYGHRTGGVAAHGLEIVVGAEEPIAGGRFWRGKSAERWGKRLADDLGLEYSFVGYRMG